MASKYLNLLEAIVECGRKNNKMYDYAAITLSKLTSRDRNDNIIGEALANFRSAFSTPICEGRYSTWLKDVKIVKEKVGGYGVSAIMGGKEYRYTKPGMSAEELLDKINQIWDTKGPGAVGQFLRNECECYYGCKAPSEEGQLRTGYLPESVRRRMRRNRRF